jgi:polyisoprenoid-binding protein YceI
MPDSDSFSTWNIDPAHSHAEFKVRHMMISNVKGSFSGLTGALTEHLSDSTLSSVQASIPVATLTTGDAQRDGHLKSPDFFDADKFPALTFKSLNVDKIADGEYVVSGELTIHGVTRTASFNVEGPTPPGKDPWGNTRIGLSATAKINRKDYGLSWNATLESGGFLVGEEVHIALEVQFIKAAQ